MGSAWFLQILEERRGKPLLAAEEFQFTQNGDRRGWHQGDDKLWYATLFIKDGRIENELKSQLAGFFQQFGGRIRLTTNQNLQITHIQECEIQQVHWRLNDLGLSEHITPEVQAAHTLSCVSLPTCGLAMAEAERYTDKFLAVFNQLKHKHELNDLPITLCISGCPNGCARPYLAEIALTGRAPGLYHLYLGGSFHGDRMAKLYATNQTESDILKHLDELLSLYKKLHENREHFGDFLVRCNFLNNPLNEKR